jgi:hypothetical protein
MHRKSGGRELEALHDERVAPRISLALLEEKGAADSLILEARDRLLTINVQIVALTGR